MRRFVALLMTAVLGAALVTTVTAGAANAKAKGPCCGTTLLIMVGVALDTLQVIESYLLTQKYDGLIKSGRIQGRSTSGVQMGQPQ